MMPKTYKHIYEFLALVITNFMSLSRIYGFKDVWNLSSFDDRSTVLQNLSRVGSSLLMALSTILKKSSGDRCSTFLSFAARFIAKASNYIAPILELGNKISLIT
jgi:hypothetical protein